MAPLLDLIHRKIEPSGAYYEASQCRYLLRRGRTAHAKVVLPKKDSCVQHETEQGLSVWLSGFPSLEN